MKRGIYAMARCLFVCHKPELCRNRWMDGAVFRHLGYPPLCCNGIRVSLRIRALSSDAELSRFFSSFAVARRPSQVLSTWFNHVDCGPLVHIFTYSSVFFGKCKRLHTYVKRSNWRLRHQISRILKDGKFFYETASFISRNFGAKIGPSPTL